NKFEWNCRVVGGALRQHKSLRGIGGARQTPENIAHQRAFTGLQTGRLIGEKRRDREPDRALLAWICGERRHATRLVETSRKNTQHTPRCPAAFCRAPWPSYVN